MKFQTSPLRLNSFNEMSIAPALLTALEKLFITKPTDIQSQAIPAALKGSDIIAIAQTGSGKTLAFALSILTNLLQQPESRALVLAPTREMAQQIYKVFLELCSELPISVCLAIGGTTGSKQANQLKKNPRLIVATPGRMNDHLMGNKLLLQNVGIVVIDEADRMLDMGFAPQLKNIQSTLRGPRQTLMFSASFGQNVESIAQLFMAEKVLMIRSNLAEEPVTSLKQ
ncbi:MAG: DEAD/DEAH box helicase, partial [Pseudobdellovibrionaceae bacterium]